MGVVSSFDCVVIGAGVIGLGVARALALKGREVLVLEKNEYIGMETSSRNSEVIHAGIYYAPGSLKARLCVEGRRRLYDFCEARGVAYQKTGKLIVATHEGQLGDLHAILQNGLANGVFDLRLVESGEAKEMEPHLTCIAAIHSPSSGIIDTHALMLALQGEAESKGALFAFGAKVERIILTSKGFTLEIGGRERTTLTCNALVNAAGLYAVPVAEKIIGLPNQFIPKARFAKGNYFRLSGPSPFRRLIYPIPQPGGLGIHVTHDLAGQARFGPDVEWIDEIEYAVDSSRATQFYTAIRRYWPQLPDGALQADYAGIRPKIEMNGEIQNDFIISGPAGHSVADLVNLFGIESPGLTCVLSLADEVVARLQF